MNLVNFYNMFFNILPEGIAVIPLTADMEVRQFESREWKKSIYFFDFVCCYPRDLRSIRHWIHCFNAITKKIAWRFCSKWRTPSWKNPKRSSLSLCNLAKWTKAYHKRLRILILSPTELQWRSLKTMVPSCQHSKVPLISNQLCDRSSWRKF